MTVYSWSGGSAAVLHACMGLLCHTEERFPVEAAVFVGKA